MDLEFRATKLPDADIRKLQAATAKEPFAADVLSGRVKFRECVRDGRVVGHCIGNSRTGEILGLSVDPDHRRQGIARTLLSLVVDALRADGARRIWLAAPGDSAVPAHHFYHAQGWRQTGEGPAGSQVIPELPTANAGDAPAAAHNPWHHLPAQE
jgi:ribosomal protein S18 acetylase RimI-like enzyme